MIRPGPRPGRPRRLEEAATILISRLRVDLAGLLKRIEDVERYRDAQLEQEARTASIVSAATEWAVQARLRYKGVGLAPDEERLLMAVDEIDSKPKDQG